jgi:hypothetical protein
LPKRLSKQGRYILKQEQIEVERAALAETEAAHAQSSRSTRAARRTELHHVNLAGKGGLLLDTKSIERTYGKSNGGGAPSATTTSSPKAEEKNAALWDLDDCRSWLLTTSRHIAQRWVEERKKEGPAASLIPSGTMDELEGRLVELSLVLCEHLESELNDDKLRKGGISSSSSKRVVTPRVADMSKLGITWQKASTNVTGGSATVSSAAAPGANGAGRTAGQMLILKTSKKVVSIIKDELAGEAIHKELRAVIARQEERKRVERLEEASRQRFNQMKRKPWLQARVEAPS